MKDLPINLIKELADLELAYLQLALKQSQGNGAQAARLLGLNYTQWRYQLAKLKCVDSGS